jgi:hypothetical protein
MKFLALRDDSNVRVTVLSQPPLFNGRGFTGAFCERHPTRVQEGMVIVL